MDMRMAALVLFALLWQSRVRWFVALPLALVVVAAVYQVFAVWLRVPLPLGWWAS